MLLVALFALMFALVCTEFRRWFSPDSWLLDTGFFSLCKGEMSDDH